ncbi:MAG TPA: 50S ribosomal protein L3 [Stenomitos sp.]
MSLGILGKKLGMTQIFDANGQVIPVTVVEAGPCFVTQVKTTDKDGYQAIQVGFSAAKEKHLTKGQLGHLKQSGKVLRHLKEFRLDSVAEFAVGQEIKPDIFTEGQLVDVTGTSIGKGFAGMQKRFHSGRGPMSHGSKFHRHPGSIGSGTTPQRVFKGVKMPGNMGNEQVTVRRLRVVRIDAEQGILLIRGAIPGAEGGVVTVRPAVKVGR